MQVESHLGEIPPPPPPPPLRTREALLVTFIKSEQRHDSKITSQLYNYYAAC